MMKMTRHPSVIRAGLIIRSPLAPMILLAALSLPLFFYGLGSGSVINGDEGFYHSVANTMLENGSWFRLEFTGEHRVYDTFMNAPLQYWARTALISVFGDSYWTMRGLSALFACLSVLATFVLIRQLAGRGAAMLAALVQLTTFQFVYVHSARTGELEPVLCFVLTLSALTFLRAVQQQGSFLSHCACIMILANLKTPLVVIPLLADVFYFAMVSESRSRIRSWFTACLILPLGFAWHLGQLAMIGNESFESLEKMLNQASGPAVGGRAGNIFFYARSILFGSFPWSLTYLPAIAWLLTRRPKAELDQRFRLLLAYSGAVIVFFLLLGKHMSWYLLPACPFLSGIVGIWLTRLPQEQGRFWTILVPALTLGLLLWLEPEAFAAWKRRAVDMHYVYMTWRQSLASLATPLLGLGVSIALLVGLAEGVRRALGARFSGGVAIVLGALLLVVAAARVLSPLGEVAYTSHMHAVRGRLDAERAAGIEPRFPIHVFEPGDLIVRYYFGNEFKIERRIPGSMGGGYHLVAHGHTPHKPR